MGLVSEEVKDKKENIPPNNNIPDVESSELKHTNESIKESIKESTKESIDEPTQETAPENSVVVGENKGDLIVSLSAH